MDTDFEETLSLFVDCLPAEIGRGQLRDDAIILMRASLLALWEPYDTGEVALLLHDVQTEYGPWFNNARESIQKVAHKDLSISTTYAVLGAFEMVRHFLWYIQFPAHRPRPPVRHLTKH